ncbi:MAG TPA: hypothetical protein VFR97_05300 [Capillimicrobium sp.]|nr:hypothetical protein [Capillimicrobium sp.]
MALAAVALAGCEQPAREVLSRLEPPRDERAEREPQRRPARQPVAAPDRAPAPAQAPADADGVSPGAPSDAEVRAELERLYGAGAGEELARRVTLAGGHAIAPPDAPGAVQAIVAAANRVAKLPYVYGGGHGRGIEGMFVDSAYDCSGSISFALAAAGLIDRPMTSGELARWGRPGQGEWVTIYANAGHAFMVVGGVRFDTVGLRETGSRWQRPFRTVSGFTAVHPPGL